MNMSKEEQKAYLEILLYVATLDDSVDDKELAMFEEVARASDIEQAEIDEMKIFVLGGILSIEEMAKDIIGRDVKLALIEDLIALCFVDGEYSPEEKEGMSKICDLLSVDSAELKKIERSYLFEEGKKKIKSGIGFIGNGLATLGEKGLATGKIASKGIAKGLGIVSTKVSDTFASMKRLKQENLQLREMLKKTTISEAVKQKVIVQLNDKISSLTNQLKAERERNQRNEEMIALLQAQLDDLAITLETAEEAKVA